MCHALLEALGSCNKQHGHRLVLLELIFILDGAILCYLKGNSTAGFADPSLRSRILSAL
jgi:hypothetical protein